MKTRDIGELVGDVLVFGGPYSNLQATRAVIAMAKASGIPATNCICTGDVVAYCADPAETIAALRDFGCAVVAGNCERQLAAEAEDCGCGFAEGTLCDLMSAGWYAHALSRIGAADRAWMQSLPDVLTFRNAGRRHAVIHGGVSDVARFLWPSSQIADFAEEIAALTAIAGPVEAILAGHCGLAFARRIGAVHWINAGAIGMPAHDGRPETRTAILSGGGVVFHRLDYDHGAARAAMEKAGLTQGYHDALSRGIWPSEDVLPITLRRGL